MSEAVTINDEIASPERARAWTHKSGNVSDSAMSSLPLGSRRQGLHLFDLNQVKARNPDLA